MDSTAVILPIYVLLCSYIQYNIDLKETLRSWVNLEKKITHAGKQILHLRNRILFVSTIKH